MTTASFVSDLFNSAPPEPVRWLLEPALPRGRLALLDGDPAVGKSLLALDLAARLSRGDGIPGHRPAGRPGMSLFLSAEDRLADTLRPRAEAAGADLERLALVRSTTGALMRFPTDLPVLEEMIRERRAELVVVDPLMAFVPPEVAVNSDQSVRALLDQFDRLAERADCTVLLVRHLRKKDSPKAIYRGAGSVGIVGTTRVGLLAGYHPAERGLRVLAISKNNLDESAAPFAFRVVRDGAGRAAVEWAGKLDVTADELGLPAPRAVPARDRAKIWLLRELAAGPRTAEQVLAAAAEAGIPDRTLDRAKEDADVKSYRVKLKDGTRVWYWFDPAAPWPADAPFKRPTGEIEIEPLEW
jgi:hypothetical protein